MDALAEWSRHRPAKPMGSSFSGWPDDDTDTPRFLVTPKQLCAGLSKSWSRLVQQPPVRLCCNGPRVPQPRQNHRRNWTSKKTFLFCEGLAKFPESCQDVLALSAVKISEVLVQSLMSKPSSRFVQAHVPHLLCKSERFLREVVDNSCWLLTAHNFAGYVAWGELTLGPVGPVIWVLWVCGSLLCNKQETTSCVSDCAKHQRCVLRFWGEFLLGVRADQKQTSDQKTLSCTIRGRLFFQIFWGRLPVRRRFEIGSKSVRNRFEIGSQKNSREPRVRFRRSSKEPPKTPGRLEVLAGAGLASVLDKPRCDQSFVTNRSKRGLLVFTPCRSNRAQGNSQGGGGVWAFMLRFSAGCRQHCATCNHITTTWQHKGSIVTWFPLPPDCPFWTSLSIWFAIRLTFGPTRHLIHWQSLRERKIAENSAESEVARNFSLLIREAFATNVIMTLRCDNAAAMAMLEEPGWRTRFLFRYTGNP